MISRAEPTSGLQLAAGLKSSWEKENKIDEEQGKEKEKEVNGKEKKHHYFPVQIHKEQNGYLELNADYSNFKQRHRTADIQGITYLFKTIYINVCCKVSI